MKNVFIAGVARSGKSTLSKILQKNGNYNHIPLDYFTSSLKHNFPSTNITSNVVIDEISSKNLGILLSRVIEIINCQDENFIIDSAHILPKDISKYLDRDKWDVYYLGYPNISAEEKLENIRKYDTENDWTFKKNDQELLQILKDLIKLSEKIKNDCEIFNITFIDTGNDINGAIEKKMNIKK